MLIIDDISKMKSVSKELKKSSGRISFIPTMGKLHDGHARLIEEGKKYGKTVVSIFVNPIQFAPGEDFNKYPRDFDSDSALLKKLNVDCLFYPSGDIVKNTETFLINPVYSSRLEGVFRPDHFRGVLTIVMKLFSIVNPDFAFFGLKDYQQYILIKKMAEDYFLDAKVVPVETVREKCGLAMSSRNAYLNADDKKSACNFYKVLKGAAELFNSGEKSAERLTAHATKELIRHGFGINYVKIMDEGLNMEKRSAETGDLMLAAVTYKGVRLIDNIFLK